MGGLSIWHWMVLVIVVLFLWAFVAIFGRIANRAGYSKWWLVALFVPILNVIMIWIFAFADWPALHRTGKPDLPLTSA